MKPGKQFESLYHGTTAALQPGDKVLPPNVAKAGTPNSSHISVAHREGTPHDPYVNASASSNERAAWNFAGLTAVKRGGRAQVLKVGRPDDATKGAEPKEVLSKEGFPVEGVEDIRPPETVRAKGKHMRYIPNPNGRQGTLPIDWTPPGGYRGGTFAIDHGDTYNHPTQRQRVYEQKKAEISEQFRQPEPAPAPLKRIKGQMTLPGMGRLK